MQDPTYSLWYREGYCSLFCLPKQVSEGHATSANKDAPVEGESPQVSPERQKVQATQATVFERGWEIKHADGSVRKYQREPELIAAIMVGDLKGDWQCRHIHVSPDVTHRTKWKTVESSFAVFRPIRRHMWLGGTIGANIAVVLLCAFNAVVFAIAGLDHHSRLIAISFVYSLSLAVVVNIIAQSLQIRAASVTKILPRVVGVCGIIYFGVMLHLEWVFSWGMWVGVLAAIIAAALLGSLPGIAIGSSVGLLRRGRLPVPAGVEKERVSSVLAIGILLPISLFIGFTLVYILYVFPWAKSALSPRLLH